MEFSLTYFDNPGVSLPSSVTAWVAMTGKLVALIFLFQADLLDVNGEQSALMSYFP